MSKKTDYKKANAILEEQLKNQPPQQSVMDEFIERNENKEEDYLYFTSEGINKIKVRYSISWIIDDIIGIAFVGGIAFGIAYVIYLIHQIVNN